MNKEPTQECDLQTAVPIPICAAVEERICESSASPEVALPILTILSELELSAPTFAGVGHRRGSGSLAFSASAILHALVVLFLPVLLRSLPPDADREFNYRMRPSLRAALILRLPDRLYLPAPSNPAAEGASAVPAYDQRGTAPTSPKPAGADSSSTRAQSRAPSHTILIQPGKPIAEDPRANRLPALLFSKGLKANGAWGLVSAGMQPDAQSEKPPQLPISQAVQDAAVVAAASEAVQANELDVPVVSFAPALPQARQLVEIPPVNQLPASEPSRSRILSESGGAELPTTTLNGPSREPIHNPRTSEAGARPAALAMSKKPDPVGLQYTARPGGANGLSFPVGAARKIKTSSGMVTVSDLPNGTQQLRFPSAGSFDLVIVESSYSATIPDAERLLTGHPIQTVFLTLGTDRDWTLQYCLPGDGSGTGQDGMVVTLRGVPKLEPPFIQQALVPARKVFEAPLPALFHGVLGANGRFARLRPIVDAAHQAMPELLPYLEQWQFRPVRVDGTPAEVEVLLLIPAHAHR